VTAISNQQSIKTTCVTGDRLHVFPTRPQEPAIL
jgi:hypothetical protein